MSSPTADSLAADARVRRGLGAQLEARAARLAAGERPRGWKLGFGAPEGLAKLGTEGPLIGFLTDRSEIDRNASVSVAGWTRPVLEPEIAVHLGADLAAGGDIADVRAALAGLGPAFELADLDPPPEDVEEILAGNIFHRHLILGEAGDPEALDRLVGRVRVAAQPEQLVEDPAALTGEPLSLVRHVADLLGHFGERLRAGEVVICGSIVPPIQIAPGDSVTYRLDPIGELAVGIED